MAAVREVANFIRRMDCLSLPAVDVRPLVDHILASVDKLLKLLPLNIQLSQFILQ